jgi:23S rRNA (pseudouridine1915-N3)-methyltransferase
MNIRIIAVGKLKEKYWRDAVAEYSKRLGAYCSIDVTEIKESQPRANPSAADEEAVKTAEGEDILRHISKGDYAINIPKLYATEFT